MADISKNKMCWYPARTRYGQELKVRNKLRLLGVEYFIPTSQRLDYRGKHREYPMISCLVFIRATKKEACDLKVSSALPISYMFDCSEHAMMTVPDKQMQDFLKVFELSTGEEGMSGGKLGTGERVRVIKGPLQGVEGQILELLGDIYVEVDLCSCIYAHAKVPGAWLEVINP